MRTKLKVGDVFFATDGEMYQVNKFLTDKKYPLLCVNLNDPGDDLGFKENINAKSPDPKFKRFVSELEILFYVLPINKKL